MRRSSSTTGKAWNFDSAAIPVTDDSSSSWPKERKSSRSRCSTAMAERQSIAVVAESCGVSRSVTSFWRASNRTSSVMSRPPVTMTRRTRFSMARRWMSSRSPTTTTSFSGA